MENLLPLNCTFFFTFFIDERGWVKGGGGPPPGSEQHVFRVTAVSTSMTHLRLYTNLCIDDMIVLDYLDECPPERWGGGLVQTV